MESFRREIFSTERSRLHILFCTRTAALSLTNVQLESRSFAEEG